MLTAGETKALTEHVNEKFSGQTCGGEEGVLSPFHQQRVDLARDMIRDHIWKRQTGARILDVGCNDGTVSRMLETTGATVTGLDLSEACVAAARARGIEAVQGHAQERFPFEDMEFDVVFAGEIIEHLVDPEAFLRESYRVLKRGGAIVLTTPNLASLGNRIRLLLGRYPRLLGAYLADEFGDHFHLFTVDKLKSLLERTGFYMSDHATSTVSLSLRSKPGPPFSGALASMWPTLGDILVAKGQRL